MGRSVSIVMRVYSLTGCTLAAMTVAACIGALANQKTPASKIFTEKVMLLFIMLTYLPTCHLKASIAAPNMPAVSFAVEIFMLILLRKTGIKS